LVGGNFVEEGLENVITTANSYKRSHKHTLQCIGPRPEIWSEGEDDWQPQSSSDVVTTITTMRWHHTQPIHALTQIRGPA
jgi:hypothetical protein